MTPAAFPEVMLNGPLGVQIYVSDALPIAPSNAAVARRIVRHGLRDVLDWLGQDVGPRPEDETHALMLTGGNVVASVALVGKMRELAS